MIAFNRQRETAMTTADGQSRNALAVSSWVLWIDSVGGFRLLEGERFTIGGLGGEDPADLAVRSAWRRRVATLQRVEDEYWLDHEDSGVHARAVPWGEPISLSHREPATHAEPQLRLHKPSPLSRTAVVTLDPPHRFVSPVDAVLLVDATVLIGQARHHHIRTPQYCGESLVLSKRDDQWRINRSGGLPKAASAISIVEGQSIEIDSLVMTLRRESVPSILGELSRREKR